MRTHITIPLLATAAFALAPAAADASSLTPPVVKETFTPLACKGSPAHRSTVEMEGCAEQQVLSRDKTINALNRQVFAVLHTASGQRAFVSATAKWLGYRNAFCATAASEFSGGTEAPVVAAQCDAKLDAEHVTDLRTLLQDR
jgi:uncharacterized protein YecT (DUF1311 family)